MITSLEQDINKKRSSILKLDLNAYSVNKNHIAEYPKRIWFKGSRHR